jgi:integrase
LPPLWFGFVIITFTTLEAFFKSLKKFYLRALRIIEMDNKQGRNGTLSASAINRAITCLRIMLDWALENGYIRGNPIAKNLRIEEINQERGTLTLEEIKILFSDEAIKNIWVGNLCHYVASLLSVSTGMREGEILGLQREYVFENHILIMHSWSKSYGLTEPKWGGVRPVHIPSKTLKHLHSYMEQSTYQEPKNLVFHGRELDRLINEKTLIRAFYRALEKIGVSSEERKIRNIVFHSMRHTFNSIMRGKIHDSKLRSDQPPYSVPLPELVLQA